MPDCWRQALLVFLSVRIMASAVAALAWTCVPANPVVSAGGYAGTRLSPVGEILLSVWERSDALWYAHLALEGYGAAAPSTAFMPLYPGLIRALSWFGLSPLGAGLLVSNVAFLLALVALFRLARRDFGPEVARQAVWYQAIFPASFFLLAPYTESLFLALAVGALLTARQGRWRWAGLLGGLLSATRTVGILILPALFLEFLSARRRGHGAPWLQVLWLGLVPVGLLGVMLLQAQATGDPLAFLQAQDGWQRQFTWPWLTIWGGLRQGFEFAGVADGGIYLFEAMAALYALVLGIGLLRMPACYGTLAFLSLLVPLLAPYPGNLLMSLPRFVAVVFPLHLVLARWTSARPGVEALVRTLMTGLYGLATALYVASRNMF
ncbi:MAG: mannosyltransferase family protein [Candidatus Xenobium sp.]